MDYGATDTSTTSLNGTSTQFPIGEVYVPNGTQTPASGGALTALEGGPASTDSASPAKRSAPASMYIKDGNNVTFGAEADTAVTDSTQTTKTHMAFLKGLIKIFADVWDGTNHWLQVKIMNANANGQAIMTGSSPVVIASDQAPVAVKGATVGSPVPGQAFLAGFNNFGGNSAIVKSAGLLGFNAADNDAMTAVAQYVLEAGTTGQFMAVLRTPTVFKTITASATGNTAAWTPVTSRRFRLMRYKIDVTQNAVAAAAAVLTIKFQDATTDINLAHSVFIPSAAATTFGPGWSSGWIDLGNGYASTAVNNALNINLSFALTGGNVRVIAIGTEEL